MPAVDTFSSYGNEGLASPLSHGFAITPHDTNELAYVTRAIHVGTGGNLKITTVNGETITLNNVVAGDRIPIRAKLVFSTGTTASNLIGLY